VSTYTIAATGDAGPGGRHTVPRLLAVSVGRVAPLFAPPADDDAPASTSLPGALAEGALAEGALAEGAPAQAVADARGPAPRGPVSAIRKSAISTLERSRPVEVRRLGVAGDEQADLSVHGGIDKAVYVYPAEHYPFWRDAIERAGLATPLLPGAMGENLTIEGLTEAQVWVGDRLEIGRVELLVVRPRQPCFKFDARMGFSGAGRAMVRSGFTGFYCEVVRPGFLSAGDEIRLHEGRRTLTIRQAHALEHRRQRDLFE
jgi:MOSC domain-containing protein YiiM